MATMSGDTDIILSVLDQSPLRPGCTGADALRDSIELVKFVEKLGYHRYWVAEHHSSDGLASASPEILITRLAAETETIRVGSGGVMLSHYSPYKVAENFCMLEAMYPGRIDLGIGRAPGSDHPTAQALAYGGGLGVEHFPTMIADLSGFLADSLPPDHPFKRVKARPRTEGSPPIWLLGSSNYSAAYAAHFGLAFSFAHFITPFGGDAVMRAYQSEFQPAGPLEEPMSNVGIFVICADTEEEADDLMKCRDLFRLRADRGELAPIPSLEEALAYPYSDAERQHVMHARERAIYGDPEQCKRQILALRDAFQCNEFVVLTACPTFEARCRSYELLAEAFA
jgi:luciferase family oxidoreductase group 1